MEELLCQSVVGDKVVEEVTAEATIADFGNEVQTVCM